MKLEIESQDELEAAIAAVEKVRQLKVRHAGRYASRMLHPCAQTGREKIFAEAWDEANNPPSFLNGGYGTLRWLLCSDKHNLVSRDLTPEEAMIGATVIQWLGTSCGFCWLQETLEKIRLAEKGDAIVDAKRGKR